MGIDTDGEFVFNLKISDTSNKFYEGVCFWYCGKKCKLKIENVYFPTEYLLIKEDSYI